jgi:hypothetical protein
MRERKRKEKKRSTPSKETRGENKEPHPGKMVQSGEKEEKGESARRTINSKGYQHAWLQTQRIDRVECVTKRLSGGLHEKGGVAP